MQNWIANEVLRTVVNNTNANIFMETVPMKESSYVDDDFGTLL